MSYVTTQPEMLSAAAGNLHGIGAVVSAGNAAAAGPTTVCVPPVSSSSNWPPASVIVRGVLKRVGSKTIWFAPSSAFARSMAARTTLPVS